MLEKDNMTFEGASARLAEIVKILEQGNSSLEESLKLYEEGVLLVRFCNDCLDNAEKKIKMLSIDSNGKMVEKDFFEEK